MTKVSKNIKKLRAIKKLTQDDIAKKLFVTRQTVSSWESGRTQPDIEMLCKLSELFDVPVEMLIYGEKRFATDEEKTQNTKRSLIIIFSVIASVLTAIGLILIFVTYWEMFPLPLQTVLGFVPMLAGQAAALFTFIKKRESIAWRESASVLWCAGVAATIALIDSVYLMPTDFGDCLLIDTLLFLPVIYILDSVMPLIIYYGSIIYNFIFWYDGKSAIFILTVTFLLYIAGLVFVVAGRKKKDDIRQITALWVSVLAGIGILIINLCAFSAEPVVIFIILTAVFLCLYLSDTSETWALPFKPLGILGTTAMSIVSVFLLNPDAMYAPYNGFTKSEKISFYVSTVICIAAVATMIIIRRKNLTKNKMKAIFCIPSFVLIFSQSICCCFFPEENNIVVYLLILLSAFSIAFTLVAKGVINSKFLILNIGLLSMAILIFYIIYNLIELSMLGTGIMLVIFGIALFSVNFLLSKKIKTKKEANTNA